MGLREEDTKKAGERLDAAAVVETQPSAPPYADPVKDVSEEKSAWPPEPEKKVSDSKALAIVEKATDPPPIENNSSSIKDRDAFFARVETEKRLSLIKAWEESERVKAENKSIKKLSAIASWENSKKATVEAELKMIEEELAKKKAEYVEKMKNKIAMIHKEAEEKRAFVEAKRGEEFLKIEEMAAKYRAKGFSPKNLFGCFGGL